ncbi:MAG: hypothetical protein E7572_05935 [Ruminococcaceae bacterium]|jgi:hypothetical protein|nr:hypothetical protein [Oscillospiraceae bacterium]
MIYAYNNGAWHRVTDKYSYSNGAWHKVKEKYTYSSGVWQKVYSSGKKLSDLPVGSLLKISESGVPQQYIVVHQGNPDTSIYDASCNGTWVLRKYALDTPRAISTSNLRNYSTSDMHTFLSNTFIPTLSTNILQIKVPYIYTPNSSVFHLYTGSDGLSVKAFLLSYTELGGINATNNAGEGSKLAYFSAGDNIAEANSLRTAYTIGGTNIQWWTRSPFYGQSTWTYYLYFSGYFSSYESNISQYVRPAMILDPAALCSSVPDSDNCYTLQ